MRKPELIETLQEVYRRIAAIDPQTIEQHGQLTAIMTICQSAIDKATK